MISNLPSTQRRGLRDRVALVTGAAGGLGTGIASALAQQGVIVFCGDTRDARNVADTLPNKRGRAVQMDVSKAIEVDRVIELITNEHGRLDLLVNNAGVAQPATELIATTDEIIDRVIAVNVRGVLYCSRAAARIMVAQKSGRIINISSQAGKCGVPNWVIYSASKAAVVGMTQALALELAAHSITVNCVCPGPMLTEMTRTSVRDEAEALGRSEEEMLFERGESVPVGRLGTPDDIGAMVAWIASDESAFTTGASFNLTGGESVFF